MPHATLVPLLAFLATLVGVSLLARGRLARMALDRPNERSLHDTPVPRTGGLGIHAGVLLAGYLGAAGVPPIVWLCFAGLLTISFTDDIRGIPIVARLLAHLLASGAVAAALLSHHGIIIVLLATLAITWMINLYNFMDGADGLAGGMAMFGFGTYGIAAWQAGSVGFAWLNFGIAASALAFLFFNFHPARIFMGDAGSVPLGFLAACFGLIGWLQKDWPWWLPLLVFSPFIVDASVTLARRVFARAAVWQAHRDHYYQRLVQLGWGHRKTAIAEYALMLLCGIAALAGLKVSTSGQHGLLFGAVLCYGTILLAIEIVWHRTRKSATT